MAGGSENNSSHQRNERRARSREFKAQIQALRGMVGENQRTCRQLYVEESERRMRRNNERMQALMHIQQSVKDPTEQTVEMNRFNHQWIQAEEERRRALNEQIQALTNMETEMHAEINRIYQQDFKEWSEMRSRIHNRRMQKWEELNREIRKTNQKNKQSLNKVLERTQELSEMISRIYNQQMQKREEWNREIPKTSQKNERSLKKFGRTQQQGYSSHSKTKTKKKSCTFSLTLSSFINLSSRS